MARSRTSYTPGVSGNKGGRPAGLADIRTLARTYTQDAIDTLVYILKDDEARESARIAAATLLLDRGWGKPEKAMQITNVELPIQDWSTAQLTAFLQDITSTPLDSNPFLIEGKSEAIKDEQNFASNMDVL